MNARKYVEFIEEFLGVEVEWIGIGPERSAMIRKGSAKAEVNGPTQ